MKSAWDTSVRKGVQGIPVSWSTRDSSVRESKRYQCKGEYNGYQCIRGSTSVKDCAKETNLGSVGDTSARKYKGYQCNKEYKGDLRKIVH